MKIAIDYQCAYGKRTGIGVFAKTLVEGIRVLAPQIDLLCYANPDREDLNTLERIFWESFQIPLKSTIDRPNIVYSPGFASPAFSPIPKVVTVHDLIGVVYPENQGRISRFYWSRWVPFSLKRARILIASSEATKHDMVRFLRVPENQIEVVPLAANGCFRVLSEKKNVEAVLAKYGVTYPYLISVGTLEPRKNLLKLLQAFESIHDDYHILIVGKSGIAEPELKEYVREKRLEPRVHFLGYINDEDLVGLYNGALGYATMSLYEGFGLPPLEAMSSGVSGICSNRTSLAEVVGDTALLVDPENVDEIKGALRRFLSDWGLRSTLAQKAYERSKLFSTEVLIQRMIKIFERACS